MGYASHHISCILYNPMPDVSQIIATENNRLQEKKTTVDNAIARQRRQVALNDNYRKRYSKYTQIMMIFVVAIGGVLLISMLPKWFPVIPSVVADILVILLIIVLFFIVKGYYSELTSRNPLDYDELDLPPVVGDGERKSDDKVLAQQSGSLSELADSGNVCVGSECCPTRWNANANQCGFTTLTDAYESEMYATDKEIQGSIARPYMQNHITRPVSAAQEQSAFLVDATGNGLTFTAYA